MPDTILIHISIATQKLVLTEHGQVIRDYPVSTAAKGCGCESGSYKTPTGWHRIRLKIGDGQAIGAAFSGRRLTGEIYTPERDAAAPGRDWILTRILWLDGLEYGRNKGGNVDTLRRYVYIHGTPDDGMINPPSSHGCIRMFNADIVDLFARVANNTRVLIESE